MIFTRTPLRISLLGGGTDLPAFYRKYRGAVVSFAVNKYIYVAVNKKFDGKLRVSYSKTENVSTVGELQHDLVREALSLSNIKSGLEITSVSDIPGSGTGLGSSSAFTVGLLHALYPDVPAGTLAERAFTVEAEKCLHPVGKQDAYAAAFGGINRLIFHSNHVEVNPVNASPIWLELFERHALLLWTGLTRDANEILKHQRKSFEDGGNMEIGKQLAGLANEFYEEMAQGATVQRVGEFLQEGWKIKKFMAHGISNSRIDALYDTAMRNGAYGGKLLGAGGGGFLLFMACPLQHAQIVRETGLRKVDFKIERKGSEVIYAS